MLDADNSAIVRGKPVDEDKDLANRTVRRHAASFGLFF